MVSHQAVWKGVALVSLFLVLFSFNVSAWSSSDMDAKMDDMKSEMDATFDAKFEASDDGDSNTDANDETNSNSGSVTVSQDAEVNRDRTSQSWNNDDSDSNDVDMEKKMDGIKQHINAKFAFHSTSDDSSDDNADDRNSDSSDETNDEPADDGDDSSEDTNPDDSDATWNWNNDASDDDDTDDSNDDSSDDSSNDNTNDDSDSDSDNEPRSLEEETEQALHDLINDEREQRGLQPFNWDSGLAETADRKSDDMAERNYFSHYDPEGDNFRDIYNQFDYNCRIPYGGSIYLGGENIARTWFDRNVRTDTGGTVHYDNAQELADGLRRQWMTSDGHRRAILRPYYENHGLGVEIASDGRVYATEHFC